MGDESADDGAIVVGETAETEEPGFDFLSATVAIEHLRDERWGLGCLVTSCASAASRRERKSEPSDVLA